MTLASILSKLDKFEAEQSCGARESKRLWAEFGGAVRNERKRQGIGLKDFAALMGFSRAMCSYLESGKREWNFDIARKAVKILKA